MRISLASLALAFLLVAGCDDDVEDAPAKTAASEATATAAAPPPILSTRRAAPPVRAGDSAPAAMTPAARAPAGATSRAADVERGTGGPGPRRRVVEPDPPFVRTPVATFNQPWAMTFLPDGRALVTEKAGQLKLVDVRTGSIGTVSGVPAVAVGGQGGLGDVILHPNFAGNRRIYLSYIERSGSNYGAVVVHARLELDTAGGGHLSQVTRVWEQVPKVTGQGHFSHRLAFDASGKLWITSGDRQKFDPAQDMGTNLGKIIRLDEDGSVPADNPFFAQGGVAAQVWTLGHRNMLGIAFDAQGRLWVHEMGPEGGDELNLILRGRNYGWPLVSNGNHYGGAPIPGHSTRPDLEAPKAWWTPVIAPSGMIIYSGDLFPTFRGQAFIGGLASQALIRVRFDGTNATEHRRYPMGQRIREVEQGPDGAIWLLEDANPGRLLKLTPPA
ncbi:glucose/arabinose dehydrogenase [Luteimonas sp. J16]|uniref:PQQ-dependent sugar dehydrogenase n=1 Tax=unclassified Luteimonas TaxID=2629088 RepID=UPI0004B00576|nr:MULTISPECIES: PQQ-dependent sugar dehydrogenase [unclassified Luteimonas]TWG93126.1 glucose/arabinose dehydrogenase [Luteimonas sp. J16]